MLSEPLPYHLKIRDYFKEQSGVWSYFSAPGKKEEQQASLKSDRLKNTYQLSAGSEPLLHEKVNIIREKLELNHLTVTAYKEDHSSGINARLASPGEEAYLVFSEEILQSLDDRELVAHIAHELAHIQFCSLLDGDLEITDRIIMALAGSPDSGASYHETARLFQLYKEIYCDRAAYGVLGEAGPVITMLSKRMTELSPGQVEMRTRALNLWREKGREPLGVNGGAEATGTKAEAAIAEMVEGSMELDRLDVLAQAVMLEMTRGLLNYCLQPEWIRSSVVLALAREYFSDLEVVDGTSLPDRFRVFAAGAHQSIREYFAYVLLDLALVDPKLGDKPLGHARELAETLGLTSVLEPIIKKETTYNNDAH